MSLREAFAAIGIRPGSIPAPPAEPRPAPKVNACDLAYAAREAVAQVLPASWHTLPDGGNTAAVLAGTIANHYADTSTITEPKDLPWP